MRRSPAAASTAAVLAALLLSTTEISAYAAGAVAGRVLLPAPGPAPRMPERYRALSPNVAMEPPDAPAAIVYLEPAGASGAAGASDAAREGEVARIAATAADASAKVSVAQKGLQFRPALMAVRTGEAVEFPNLDDTYHSVFSYSKTKRFDLGRYRKGEDPASIVFDKPGVVTLFCEIHDHMRGAILVLDTPYFTKTKEDGTFSIDGVAPGRYRLTAWRDEDHVRTRDIDVGEAEVGGVELDVR